MSSDTIPVRKGEELDTYALEAYLRAHLSDMPDEPLQVAQFPSGHSNLTYVLSAGSWEAVLRRPPLGPVAPKAHDMKRESTVLEALHPIFPLAPEPYLYTDDTSIIGSEFFVMERRHGVVIDTAFPEGIDETPEKGRRISQSMVDTLVTLHSLDYSQTKLAEMTKPDGFLERQVYGWIKRYDKAKTDDVAGVAELTDWLAFNIPTSPAPAIIHYDFKCNNALFDPNDVGSLRGLFDWEMTTVGDPLADLGVALSYWIEEDDPEALKKGFGKTPVTVREGFYSRREFAEAYARQSGSDLTHLHFHVTFAYFKLAVIAQQIYYRFVNGQTDDQRFAGFDRTVAALIAHANKTAKSGL
ncbi:phosphotransferase family protein [Thalassobacillus sp. CUG 92003]|uniref:phosphotransferase family protein n=1 Tax=Thalassobacillus sp. CUG 92003 TaxID=2736641 RepID=UPI0015E74A94|nr:phosphotransferase family protein [Thalassobacillus sp. CUG 92003]